jgi:Zn-dependent peptidase ImmA (M78 family)/transcriptional regulator with XRE-family HTH domain
MNNLATNIRRLRGLRGLTQAEAAKEVGISRPAYRDLEAGNVSDPKSSTLIGLALHYNVPIPDLLKPADVLTHVRFRASKAMKGRDQILADVHRRLSDVKAIEDALDDPLEFGLSGVRQLIGQSGIGPKASPEMAAELTRAALGLGPKEAVHDLPGLLAAAGVRVLTIQVQTRAFFGFSIWEDGRAPTIIVNTWDKLSVETWIDAAARELGHLLLHAESYDVTQVAEVPENQDEAGVFADHLLLPAPGFAAEWYNARGLGLEDRVLKIKRIFRVSRQTVLNRLDGKSKTEVDAPKSPRTREPAPLLPTDFMVTRVLGLVRRAVEKQLIDLDRAAEVLRVSTEDMSALAASWV